MNETIEKSGTNPSRHAASIVRETVIGMIINMAISAAFFVVVFGFAQAVPIGGMHGLAVDFVPQTFMIALMSGLVPSLIAPNKLGLRISVVRLLIEALGVAFMAMLVMVGVAMVLIENAGSDTLAPLAAFPLKLAFAAALTVVVTPFTLRRLLRRRTADTDPTRPSPLDH